MRVLFVKQDYYSPGGLIGDGFVAAGWDVSEMTVVPAERYDSPDVTVTFPSVTEYDAVAFFGAVWSVCDADKLPWIAEEISYARSLISLGVPVLGICFGGQMLAAALGGTVSRAPIPEVGWVSVASDDPALIDYACSKFQQLRLPPNRYEFQMLLGIRRDLQQKVLAQGHPFRVYVPFGEAWVPYFMRRLSERPANLYFVLRSLLAEGKRQNSS